ncbi:MAG: DUF3987 domain-containing protein [Cyclobacteriaceae bacterium]|nr:DUF3987 domain-containing protein [Cyclobacteriaceae bacterium]
MSFKNFLKSEGLATFTTDQLKNEVIRRQSNNTFPMHVFNEKIKPFLDTLNKGYDLPASYIGTTLLSAYSTAIGTAYKVNSGNDDFVYLPVWACLCGISSSGGTTAINKLYAPLFKIQSGFDSDWQEKTRGLSREKVNMEKMETVVYRDSHIPTLVRTILPDNPKGLCKHSDELLEWINGMNQLTRREGTDEQFWISSWNCTPYSGIRSGKDKFVIQRPFVNVIGKAQYPILNKLFTNDRDTTGFIFRMLFALPEEDSISQRDSDFVMPAEWTELHERSLTRLYKDLPVHDAEGTRCCVIDPPAKKLLDLWRREKTQLINRLDDSTEQNIKAGILGKVSEYAYRFAALLHLADKTFDQDYSADFHIAFKQEELITANTMNRALQLAEYFYQSANEVYDLVQKSLNAPPEVLATAFMMKRNKSNAEIGEMLYSSKTDANKVKARRQIERWIREYPRVFGAYSK